MTRPKTEREKRRRSFEWIHPALNAMRNPDAVKQILEAPAPDDSPEGMQERGENIQRTTDGDC